MQGLGEADRLGLVPVVDMEDHKTFYNEKQPVNGTRNAWEYYFEQPGGMTLAEARKNGPAFSPLSWPSHAPAEKREERIAGRRGLLEKYIRVKPEILAEADAVISAGVHGDILGVHVRGTDMRRGHFPLHPIPDVPLAYVEKARLLDREYRFSKVFLATDEIETVELFQKEFGPRLLITGAYRTSAGQPTPRDFSWLLDVERSNHRYMLGREVLVDTLLLSRCGHFLGGDSNIFEATMLFSDTTQRCHEMPAIWVLPGNGEQSIGLERLGARTELPEAIDVVGVLVAQKNELYRLLAAQENRMAKFHHEYRIMKRYGYRMLRLMKFWEKLKLKLRKKSGNR